MKYKLWGRISRHGDGARKINNGIINSILPKLVTVDSLSIAKCPFYSMLEKKREEER